MASPLGQVGVAVDGSIDPLLKKFAAAEAAADAFYKRMSSKLARIPVGGASGGAGGADAAQAADRVGKAMAGAAKAGDRYHQTLIQVANDNRTLIQIIDNSSRTFNNQRTSIDASSRSLSNITNNYRQAGAAAGNMAGQAQSASSAAADLRRTLLASASVIVGAFGVNEIKNLADGYTRFTNQLKVAGLEGSTLIRTQDQLFGQAQKYGVELESLGTLYGRLAQSQSALGATSAQMMQFTNGVAAAIKVQGAGAEQVKGALLQLSQAMGSPIVRAEEFNSVNEGARPILQAVANGIDRYGGSVAKLRNEVIAGKVTSQEFFQGFLNGSAQLESQAAQANLTIGASFQTLNNALGRYIGQTDQSLSATQRVGGGIQALARNLDVVMPILTALILAMGARYAVAAGSMVASTTLAQVAVAAFRVVTQGTVASVAALGAASATAGRAMLAAFGGPIGVAILAIGAAVYYFYQRTQQANKEIEDFNSHQREATKILETERQRAAAASGAVKALGTDHATATNNVRSFAGATGDAAKALNDQARAARRARFDVMALASEQAKTDKANADRYVREHQQSGDSIARFGRLPESPDVEAARQRSRDAQTTIDQLKVAMDKAIRDPLESYVPNARTQGRDIAAEIADLQKQLVNAQKAHNTEAQRELLKQIRIRKRITELMGQGLSFEIANAQADTESLPAAGSGPEQGARRFGRPVRGGTVRGTVGEARPGHTHAGTDYAVPVGTRVSSTAPGTVIEVGTLPGYGNVVVIDHGRGMTTRYAHLSRIDVAKGAKVEDGQQIGLSGGARGAPGAGNSRGPHLHYEVRKGGKPVDPNGQYATDEMEAANTAERLENQRIQREQAFGAQQQQMNDALLAARGDQLVDEAEIAKQAMARVNAERDRTAQEIELKRQRGEYTDAQAKELTALNGQVRDAELLALDLKERHRKEEVASRTLAAQQDRRLEQLQAEQDLARTAVERRAVERRILEAQKAYERQVLQATIASQFTKPEDRARAVADLASLDRRYRPREQKIDRDAIEDMYGAAPEDSANGIRNQERQARLDRNDRLNAVDAGTEAMLRNEQLTQDEREKILQEAADRRVEIEADAARRIVDLETRRKTMQLSNAQEIAEGLASIAEGMAGKQSKIYRAMFITAKAFAIAQSAIAIYQNVAAAMRIGFPQNLPFIAAAVAQGASIMANIQAVSGSFQVGGHTGFGADNEPAGVVHRNEYVMDAKATRRIGRSNLDAIRAGRDPTLAMRSQATTGGIGSRLGMGPMNVRISNYASGVEHQAVQIGPAEIEIIATRVVERDAPGVIAKDMGRPNSKTGKAVKRHTTARPRKA